MASGRAGTLTSDSRAAALAQMRRQGLHPVSIEEARDPAAAAQRLMPPSPTERPGKVSGQGH